MGSNIQEMSNIKKGPNFLILYIEEEEKSQINSIDQALNIIAENFLKLKKDMSI